MGSTLGPSLSVEQLMEKPVSVSVDIYNFLEKVEAFYTKVRGREMTTWGHA